jgi:Asp-tRNA(Asn)/Glu-tRNA(Gln) amidotransferase B subunit
MNATLESQIAAVVSAKWPDFAREHPALARTIDQAALGDYAAEVLADDAAFKDAYRSAVEANVGARALANLVEQFVAPVLRRLL